MTDPTLSSVIAQFVGSAATAGERRERRAALSHVDAELGTMPMRAIRTRNLTAMLDDLAAAGLSARRQDAVVEALHSLYAFAIGRGLVADDPASGAAAVAPPTAMPAPTPAPMPAPTATPTPAPMPAPTATPTLTMLALGVRVAAWTAWTIAIVFALLLVALVLELT
jgi:hypothetical protein